MSVQHRKGSTMWLRYVLAAMSLLTVAAQTGNSGQIKTGVTLGANPSFSCGLLQGQLASFTVCASVRVHVARKISTLFRYNGRARNVTIDMDRQGINLHIQGEGKVLHESFFEVKFPPWVWRHVCFAYDDSQKKGSCFVEGKEEAVSAKRNPGILGSDPVNATASAATIPAMPGMLCVGGPGHLIFEGDVVDLRLWEDALAADVSRRTSRCGGVAPIQPPVLVMGPGWILRGPASLEKFAMDEVCSSAPLTLLLEPAGTYGEILTSCYALGGTLPNKDTEDEGIVALARGKNDSCLTDDALLSWTTEDEEREWPSRAFSVEDVCPALGAEGHTWTACVRSLSCSVCLLPRTSTYNFYGHDGRLFDYTYYVNVSAGEALFSGVAGSHIRRAGRGWLLGSELHGEQWLLEDAVVPVGRRRWRSGDEEVLLTLTACLSTQFACDNGQCIQQTLRCDNVAQCDDQSDELSCQVVNQPSGYDAYYPPPPRPGESLPVHLEYEADVYSIEDVTTEGGVVTMSVGMILNWFDPRLKFVNLKPEVKNYFPCERVWTPSVRAVSGNGEGTVIDTDSNEDLCYAYASDENMERPLSDPFMGHQADGASHSIVHYTVVLVSVPCHFELQMYPFDFQLCNISFMLMNAPWSRVFHWTEPTSEIPYLNSRRVVLEYALENVTTEIGFFLQGTDNNTYFVLTYHLRRIYGYHVTNSFFPSLLMFFISYGTFYYQLDDFTNRIMISLTVQLVLASLFTSTTQSSVRTPYLKLIDVWYAAIITFCFVIIIAQTVINVLYHTRNVPKAVYRAVMLGEGDLMGDKITMVSPEASAKPGSAGGGTAVPYRDQVPRDGQVVARRYNAVCRVTILSVVLTFVLFYSFMALRLL